MAKQYKGRLTFDHDTGFHHEMVQGFVNIPVQLEDGTWGNERRKALVPGKPVVTEDGGKTWRYAVASDLPHNDRYHERVAAVDPTENALLELTLEHGRGKAQVIMREQHPHHYEVQPDDAHADGLKHDPDPIAATITSHTEAYT